MVKNAPVSATEVSAGPHGASVSAAFTARFGRAPDGVWAAPGRVNLIGDHTDYNDGFVLPFAIDRHTTVAAGRRADRVVHAVSGDMGEIEVDLAAAAPGGVSGWGAYAVSSLWALGEAGHDVGGLDLVVTSDVPMGSGLSSSAAIECAVLLAARDLFGGPDDIAALARLAQRGENEFVGVPSGVMDQMASIGCRADHALFLDTRSLVADHVPLVLDDAGLSLLVIDTRTPRSLAQGEYAKRRASCGEAAAILGVASLRDTHLASVEAASDRLGDERTRRARHVVNENDRVLKTVALLKSGAFDAIGPVLTASHASLRDDYEVSADALDIAVDAALRAGARGARMTGAGFGGCALALVDLAHTSRVSDAVASALVAAGLPSPAVFPARPSAGARRLA